MTTRTMSHWGWGWADRFPDATARAALADLVAAVLGVEGLAPADPVPLDDATLPPIRVPVPHALAPFSDARREARATHTYGRSYRDLVRGFRGDFAPAPDFVARPRAEDEVAAVIAWCEREHVALVPYGGGTSVVGGVEAVVGPTFRGVVSLDMRSLDRVLEVDAVSRAARIQAGATGPVLESQLAPHGLTLRHYPQSFEFSTLGGWIATRAGGHFATVYTHIDDLVESVRMLTPAGVYETKRVPASGAGPAPERLVLGSEGALGVITEAWMRVRPRPKFKSTVSLHFGAFDDAVRATRAVAQSGLFPSNCRLLDAREAALHQVATDGTSVLILGFESADHPVAHWMDEALVVCAGYGATVDRKPEEVSEDDAGRWKGAFFEAPYLQSALVSLGVIADTFETAVTWDRFDALHRDVIAAVRGAMRSACGRGLVTCRFTHVYPDGPAPYYTFIAPGRAGEELEQWAAIKRAASDVLVAHGATITHHHGVGRLHRPWYDRERPEPFALALRAAKSALDPSGVLNPGVLV